MANSNFLKVSSSDIGLRLDKFLFKNLSHISYSAIQKKIRKGLFKVNGVKLECLISNDGLKPCIYGRKFKFKSISTSKEDFFKNSKCITKRHFESHEFHELPSKKYRLPNRDWPFS